MVIRYQLPSIPHLNNMLNYHLVVICKPHLMENNFITACPLVEN